MGEIIATVAAGRPRVQVRQGDHDLDVPALWLRQHSPESSSCDPVTGQRLFDPHLLPVDLDLREAVTDGDRLTVTFTDGHTSTYDRAALADLIELTDGVPVPVLWRAGDGQPHVHAWAGLEDPAAERAALGDFLRFGAIVIDGLPAEPGVVLEVANRFGYVRDTNFGPAFDVRSEPDSTDLAYRAVPLTAHTDNPYRTPTPGIQLLHCVANGTTGGASTLVDGLAVVEQLRHDAPDELELLATVPVRFRYRDTGTEILSVRPVIDRDHAGTVLGLHYSPRLDEMPLLSDSATRQYQAARQALAYLLASPEFEVGFTLAAGQLMMFDNNRVLHGRTGFDPHEGLRHLQGCYIDHDGPRTRYRGLTGRAS